MTQGYDDTQREWVAGRHRAVLVTIRSDGSPQTSNIGYAVDAASGELRISVTDGRAKTHNLRRDPRCVLHVLGESFWSYLSVAATAEVGPVTVEPTDAAGRDLLEVYEAVAGTPPEDVAQFQQAMVDERRLVLRLIPVSAAGPGGG